ncbi:DUF4396 domain-containing protein [Streptomyces sp. NPDC051567]|uniref:DUF4396 domain-containing protein n=1 Tax=Streptomyces sp. NPDC051567 TaxID=3365660 RepID=UPI0037AE3DF0
MEHTHGHHEHHTPGQHPPEHGTHEHGTHEHHEPAHHGGEDHGGHGAAHHGGKVSWSTAARATLHCLTGCAIGEVLGMIIGTALGWGNVPTMVLAITLAFFFGYALTLRTVLAAGVDFRTALRVTLAADTLSITVMELIDNGVLALWPGAMDAHLSDALFWTALAIALALAFVVTVPVNRYLIGRGKGHAVVHPYH